MLRPSLAAVSLAAVLATASASGASPGRTVVHHFRGFSHGTIAPGLHVERSARGHCWTTSALEGRRYAWRCFRGNYIEDPCFSATPHSRYVLCPAELWSTRVLRLRLTKPLPGWQNGADRRAWPVGVWTATGKRCRDFSGATSTIQGRPVRYSCRGGGVLAGRADTGTPIWTIHYARSSSSKTLKRVGITDAWW